MILQSLDDLEADLRSRGFRPFYLILGPEEYQCHLAVNLLKNRVLTPESIAFDYCEFCAPDSPIEKIIEAAHTFPMMSKRRLVLVTDIDRLIDSAQDKLLDSLQDLSPRSMVILFAIDLDRRKKFYKTLRDRACVAEFPKLKGIALERWAETFVGKQGYKISPNSLKKIVELAGPDLQTLAIEIEKLLLYAGKEKNIPDSAIEDLVSNSRQHGIFELIGAISNHNRAGALRLLANLLNMGEPPLVIVTMMARHCRQVLIAKGLLQQGSNAMEIGLAAQIPSFILDQFLRQTRTADLAAIQAMYIRLADIDKRLKSSALDGRMLLEEIICALV